MSSIKILNGFFIFLIIITYVLDMFLFKMFLVRMISIKVFGSIFLKIVFERTTYQVLLKAS